MVKLLAFEGVGMGSRLLFFFFFLQEVMVVGQNEENEPIRRSEIQSLGLG